MITFKEWEKEQESLNEMAFTRAELKEKLEKQSKPLMQHILCLMSFEEKSNWDKTVANILDDIYELYKIKAHKKYLTKETILDSLLYGPYEDTDDDWIKEEVKVLSKKGMKIFKIPSFKEIEYIYILLINETLNGNISKSNVIKTIKGL
jgi:hypothetical protein